MLQNQAHVQSPDHRDRPRRIHELERSTHKSNTKVLYEALLAASQNGYLNVVKCLVEQGHANLFHKEDLNINTPLHVACAMGRSEVAIYLAAASPTTDVDQHGREDTSPASVLSHLDRDGNPPHMCAICNGNLDIARHLIETYPCIIPIDQGYGPLGLAPIHWAARINHSPMATYLLVQHQANVNLIAAEGQTPLHFACRRSLVNLAASRNAMPVVDVLLQNGANLFAVNDKGNTPLLEALRWNRVDVIKRLFEYMYYFNVASSGRDNNGFSGEGSIHHVNQDGHNALSLACENKNVEIVKLLLVNGASVFDAQGWKALTTASQARNADIVRLLVEARFGQQQATPLSRECPSSGKRKRRSYSVDSMQE